MRTFQAAALALGTTAALGQVNSWISPQSGNWEDAHWSLPTPPAPGHSVFLTNAGWKAVMISSRTVQLAPQSLNVNSLTVASPADGLNLLLLNYSGVQTALTANAVIIASNASLVALSSALRINGPNESTFRIGGAVHQGAQAQVTANQMDLGYIGPGVYHLTNGTLAAQHLYLGGTFGGLINQQGGRGQFGIVHLATGSEYRLRGGDFAGTIYFDGGTFRQQGGVNAVEIAIVHGAYMLEGGVFQGSMYIPHYNGYGSVTQTGGTNLSQIFELGNNTVYGRNSYTLSNGMLVTPKTAIHMLGDFYQWGGTHIAGTVTVHGAFGPPRPGTVNLATYRLHGGNLSAGSFSLLFGDYLQTGGTNLISGELSLPYSWGTYLELQGGLLRAGRARLDRPLQGGFLQNGGVFMVDSDFILAGLPEDNDRVGYTLAGGDLVVSNLVVEDAVFRHRGGTFTQTGLLTLSHGWCEAGTNQVQFGPLQLRGTNALGHSMLALHPGPAVVRFGPSATQVWDPAAALLITGWMGAAQGGGQHQVLFGTGPGGLAAHQQQQVLFVDPLGFPGLYQAKSLADGELVPDTVPPTGHLPPELSLAKLADGTLQLELHGEVGGSYLFETSTNLVHWNFWTTRTATNGTATLIDAEARLTPRRFYRALLLP
ncbi:MAG TPA: hypothetical protein VN673_07350 [Clostridia bacterium]|nr:hypothetical protein [Clostridia bacterium]